MNITRTSQRTCIYKESYDSAVNNHLHACLLQSQRIDKKTNKELVDLVVNSTKVIYSARNWSLLLYKKALHIK